MSPRIERASVVATIVAIAAAYQATTARAVLGGDNAEFVTVAYEGGVAHPPGYPLATLLLRAMTAGASGEGAAHAAARATALVAALSIGAVYLASRALGASRAASVLAAAMLAATSVAWKIGTHAEVFPLNALLATTIVLVVVAERPARAGARAATLGLLAGLGLANHHSIVLLAPIGLYGLGRALVASKRRALAGLATALAFGLGLSPYATLVTTARTAGLRWVWGETATFAGLLHHLRRADYGTTRLALRGGPIDPARQLAAFGAHLASDYVVVGLALGLAGIAALVASRELRARGLALAATIATTGPVFVAIFNIDPDGLGAHVVERFYLLPTTMLAIAVGPGLDALARRIPRARPLAYVVGAASVSAAAASALPEVREHHRPTVEIYLRDALATVEPDAIVLGSGDHRLFGFVWADRVLGLRRDVTFVDPRMLHYGWYHRRSSERARLALVAPTGGSLDTVALADGVLEAGRPLYLTDAFTKAILSTHPSYPVGPLVRVLPKGARPPPPDALEAMNEAIFARFRLEPTPPDDPTSWAGDCRLAYARPWVALAEARAASGDRAGALRAAERAEALAPWSLARAR